MRLAILLLFSVSCFGQAVGISDPPITSYADGCVPVWSLSTQQFVCTVEAIVPAGSILLVATGTCPAGFSEVTALDGVTLVGTLAAHGDVGDPVGDDTITPTGTISQPTFAGSALATHTHTAGSFSAAAQTFTGSSANTSAVSGGTPAGSVSAPTFTGDSVNSSAVSAGTPAGTNSTSTVTPLGTNATSTVTPLGTNGTSTAAAQTFTGTAHSCVANHVHIETINSALTGATGNGFPALLDASTSGGPTSLWMSTANNTGGSATCTPAGTNGTSSVGAQTFTGSSSTVAAQTFTGSSSTVAAQTFTGSALGTHLHATTATGTNSAPSFTGSALGTHQHTLTATGTNGSSAVSGTSDATSGGTPAGTVSTPVFTGAEFDNRQAGIKVIFCSKN